MSVLARRWPFLAAALLAGPVMSQEDLAGALEELTVTADLDLLGKMSERVQVRDGLSGRTL